MKNDNARKWAYAIHAVDGCTICGGNFRSSVLAKIGVRFHAELLMSRSPRYLLFLLALVSGSIGLNGALAPEYEAARRERHERAMNEARREAAVVIEGEVIGANPPNTPTRPEFTEQWIDEVVLTIRVVRILRGEGVVDGAETVVVRYANVFYGGGWAGPAQYRPRRLETGERVLFYLNPSSRTDSTQPTFDLAAGDMSFAPADLEANAFRRESEPRWRSRPHRPWWRQHR